VQRGLGQEWARCWNEWHDGLIGWLGLLTDSLSPALGVVRWQHWAQFAADWGGEVGPFQLAIALTVLALLLILAFFDENVGGRDVSCCGRRHRCRRCAAHTTVAFPTSNHHQPARGGCCLVVGWRWLCLCR
jgi:hypothetical protein